MDKINKNPQTKKVNYLWLAEGADLVDEEEEFIENILRQNNGAVPFERLEFKLMKRFNYNPLMRVTPEYLQNMFQNLRHRDFIEFYQLIDGMVSEKTKVYRPTVSN